MIYRPPSQTCHGGRLESSQVRPSILWMATRVPCLQINRRTPAWNWLPECHICHKANQKVIGPDSGRERMRFCFALALSEKIHTDLYSSIYSCIFWMLILLPRSLTAPCFSFSELHIFTPRSFAVQLVCVLSASEQLHSSRWWVSAFPQHTPSERECVCVCAVCVSGL